MHVNEAAFPKRQLLHLMYKAKTESKSSTNDYSKAFMMTAKSVEKNGEGRDSQEVLVLVKSILGLMDRKKWTEGSLDCSL